MEPFSTLRIQIGGKELCFETGKIARQANGSILAHCGETTVLATACASEKPTEGIDFFPLRVDYQERYSSVGRTAGGFIKREGRPSEREILVSRLIDRPIRPLFEEGYYYEVQLLSYVFSFDGEHLPDILAICASSAALVISDIPLLKPVGAVRVGRVEGRFIINPTASQMANSDLDLVMAGTEEAVLMIEGHCQFLTEEQVLEAMEIGQQSIREICRQLENWKRQIGKPKRENAIQTLPEPTYKEVKVHAGESLSAALKIENKKDREQEVRRIYDELLLALIPEEKGSHTKTNVSIAFKKLQSHLMREMILEEKRRIDGRSFKEIRPISVEQKVLSRTHGSSLFTRGETQAIAVCTLGGENAAQRYEDLRGEGSQRFYLQYFFPPFSVGEVGRMGAPGRREIGHGKLAERALLAILPPQTKFPYVIRLESTITESNGSSSMASVCGGCLALMDAGVPILEPVAGIAMGLVLEGSRSAILSDILGAEDALGDMDFKVAGSERGISAFQMDIKTEGITHQIMKDALAQAKEGRLQILQRMLETCPKPRSEMSSYAPRIEVIQINPSKIGLVIGPGGKQIRAIIEETGVEINIDDTGLVSITANDPNAMEKAKNIVHNLTAEVEIGKTYQGRITSIVPFGLFVEIFGKEGLCHISEISHQRIANIADTPFREGEMLSVKVIDVESRSGKIRLSHKATLARAVGA